MATHPASHRSPCATGSLPATYVGSSWVDPLQHPRGQAHLSAGSGLVRVCQRLYVVADDELYLGVFDDPHGAEAAAPGKLLRLLDGDLPKDAGQRKALKPDFESLVHLPALPGFPAGALLALGSGSRSNRETGVLVALDLNGAPNGRVSSVNLAALYAPLHKRFADLNIEGALVVRDELLLLQRGNQGHALNACIRFDWNLMAPWLAGLQAHPPPAKSVQALALGSVGGVSLGFTDGVALQGGAWAFSAVAENTDDSYLDGICVGSAIAAVGPDGQVRHMYLLEGSPKVEGIVVRAEGDDWVFTLVTDPDDPALTSHFLQVRVAQNVF